MNSFPWLVALTLLTGLTAVTTGSLGSENPSADPTRREGGFKQDHRLNTTAINEALAFGPYHDLLTATTGHSGKQRDQQQNLLLSPLGLASALALLSRTSGIGSQRQFLEALGLGADSAESKVAAILSDLTELEHALTTQGGGANASVQRAGNRNETATGGAVQGSYYLEGFDGIPTESRPSLNYKDNLTQLHHIRPLNLNTINLETLVKELQDKLILNNSVHFKGCWKHPFQRRHTVSRSFQLNSEANVEVPMMFRDDSAELKMLYDTNCSATVVQLPFVGRLASLLLLPKAEVEPLEDCLSDSRMSFWLHNLKPGRAEIRFPKFKMRKSYGFERLLTRSGAASIFVASAVDTQAPQGKTWKLVQALHEVTLEVDESTSEDDESSNDKLNFSVPPRITFDRPFMMIVYDQLTGLILLIGKIIDPRDI